MLIQNHDESDGLQLLESMRQATCEKVSGVSSEETPHLSIGMAVAVVSNENLLELLHLAVMRMYAQKRKRRPTDLIQASNPVPNSI